MNARNVRLPDPVRQRIGRYVTVAVRCRQQLLAAGILGLVAVEPVAAQSAGEAFCNSTMAETIKNIFTLIQFGGPLIGGVLFLGATVALPMIRRSDYKKELREIRVQGLLWGIVVTPLGTTIVQFLLNNVVAGGVSCGF